MKTTIIPERRKKRTPLVFKCECGEKLISNEYIINGLIVGGEMRRRTAKEKCTTCESMVEGGRVYRPLVGSLEYKKWYN